MVTLHVSPLLSSSVCELGNSIISPLLTGEERRGEERLEINKLKYSEKHQINAPPSYFETENSVILLQGNGSVRRD